MNRVKTIRILIAGLAAFVDGPPGEMWVLLPKVDPTHWLVDHNLYIPEHHVLLGFLEPQLPTTCEAACEARCEALCGTHLDCLARCRKGCGPGQASADTCWMRLERTEIVLSGRDASGPEPDSVVRGRRAMGLGDPTPLPREPEEIRDISWIAEMKEITGEALTVRAEILGSDHDDALEARVMLPYTRRSVCRLAGRFDRAAKRFVIPVHGFRSSPSGSESTSYRQALATATVVEIDLRGAISQVEVCLQSIGGVGRDCNLKLKPDADGVVHLAITEQVPNGQAGLHALRRALGQVEEGVDDHFRVFHHLYRDQEYGAGAVPFEVGPMVTFSQDDLDEACASPFLLPLDTPLDLFSGDKKEIENALQQAATILDDGSVAAAGAPGGPSWPGLAALWFPTNVPVSAPSGYVLSSILGPPLCPQIKFDGP